MKLKLTENDLYEVLESLNVEDGEYEIKKDHMKIGTLKKGDKKAIIFPNYPYGISNVGLFSLIITGVVEIVKSKKRYYSIDYNKNNKCFVVLTKYEDESKSLEDDKKMNNYFTSKDSLLDDFEDHLKNNMCNLLSTFTPSYGKDKK